ncbi:MAG: cytochrome c [Calditrichaceae bacterium]|jgi:hypothetical protein
MRSLIITILIITMIGCAGRQSYDASLSDHERLFRSTCRSCHRLPGPNRFDAGKWRDVLLRHQKRTNLSIQQLQEIYRYLCEDSTLQFTDTSNK